MNQLTTQIDAPTFELLVNSKSYIDVTLAASETITFTFSLSEKQEMKNILKGESTVERSSVAQPTGVSTFDIVNQGRI